MRISKEPQERKQEIIDTAMQVFIKKGYEQSTMRDIAKEVGIVPGLCYRYFASKQELFDCAVSQYVDLFCAPIIETLKKADEDVNALFNTLSQLFIARDGKETYHEFFHKKGNKNFHKLLCFDVCDKMLPYVTRYCELLKQKGVIDTDDIETVAGAALYGELPIIQNDSLSSEQKAAKIRMLVGRLI